VFYVTGEGWAEALSVGRSVLPHQRLLHLDQRLQQAVPARSSCRRPLASSEGYQRRAPVKSEPEVSGMCRSTSYQRRAPVKSEPEVSGMCRSTGVKRVPLITPGVPQ
jgi:hypothetical protein